MKTKCITCEEDIEQEKKQCFKCKIIQDYVDAIQRSAKESLNRDIQINWKTL